MTEQTPPGYKKTEIGIIPEDWEIRNLEDIAEVIDPHPSHRAPPAVSNGVPFVGIGDLGKNGNIISDKVRIVHPRILDEHRVRYNLDDNLIGLGRVASIGKVVKLKKGRYAISPTMGIIKSEKANWEYLYYSLQFNFVTEQFSKIMTGSTRSSVGMIVLRKLKVSLPPTLEEQRAIARVLSDIDNLIEALDKLIEKKKNIKKEAMQLLLTGKKRLPGFKGKWVRKRLGEIALKISTGSRNNEDKVENGKYPLFVRSDKIEKIDTYSYDCEAIIVPGEGKIGEIFHYIKGKFDAHQRVYVIREFKDVHAKYVFYYMQQFFGEHALKNSVKATVDSLRLPTFSNFEISLSPTIEEQRAIAKILSDMDAEIEALERKKKKYEMLKKGAMELLLTGKIRLKDRINEVLA